MVLFAVPQPCDALYGVVLLTGATLVAVLDLSCYEQCTSTERRVVIGGSRNHRGES
jgi:hypothetical protein